MSSINFDTVIFEIPEVKIELEKTTYLHVIANGDELVKRISNRKHIDGSKKKHRVSIRSNEFKNALLISGALHGFLYGQNVFTTSNLRRLCFETIREIRKKIHFYVSDIAREKWLAGDINILRIDVAKNFKFKSDEEALEILKQIRIQLASQNFVTKMNMTSAQWAPQNGAKYSVVFYAKGPQLERITKENEKEMMRLVDECDGVIRVEVRLLHGELKKLNLDKLSAWNFDTPEYIFNKYFSRVPLLNVTSDLITKDELDKFPKYMRTAMALHKAGIDLSLLYASGHVKRIRGYFRKEGIDFRCKSQKKTSVLLKDLFVDSRKMKIPKWLKKVKMLMQ